MTIEFAVVFTALQIGEYMDTGFTIADGAYGSCLLLVTGYHGFHVIIGTVFIAVAFYRIMAYH